MSEAVPHHVLMTADTVGGVWTYALELARALAPHGVRVTLATMGRRMGDDQRRDAAAVPGLDVHESDYKLEWMQEPWPDVHRSGDWLLGLAERLRPDLVHLNGYAHGALPWKAPVVVVAHSCVLSWWRAVKGEPAPAEWSRYGTAVRAGLDAADLVVAPTWSMLRMLWREHGLAAPAMVVPNGRDPARFWAEAKEPFVFSMGRLWDEAKNLACLGRCAPALPWPVYVAGETEHPEGGRAEAEAVRPLGRLSPEGVAGWLSRAAVYCLPARYEPFGLSALEAALSGCALVLGDIDSLREVWDDAALYAPADDAEALAATLLGVIHRPALRAELAERARARALTYSLRRMAAGYLEAYARAGARRHEQAAATVGGAEAARLM